MRAVRALVVAGAIVALLPAPAGALCIVQPFREVVARSDAVLVGTVATAEATQGAVIVSLDVERVLKGVASAGASVRVTSCGVLVSRDAARRWAEGMIGERGLYLLSWAGPDELSNYSGIMSPPMSLEEQIALAEQILGAGPPEAPTVGPGVGTNVGTAEPAGLPPWFLAAVLILATVAVVFALRRRRAPPA